MEYSVHKVKYGDLQKTIQALAEDGWLLHSITHAGNRWVAVMERERDREPKPSFVVALGRLESTWTPIPSSHPNSPWTNGPEIGAGG